MEEEEKEEEKMKGCTVLWAKQLGVKRLSDRRGMVGRLRQ